MLQLKRIINITDSDDVFLQSIKDFEAQNKVKRFGILAKILELVPLTKSVATIKQIITAYTRRLLCLLEEKNVLEDQELSQELLKCVKTFWSLCYSQQSIQSGSQFGRWDGSLIEVVTSLASVFVDLFITANGSKENQSLWSKRLYSWLNYDLPVRAIKVALLEVTGHKRDGAEVAGPLISRLIQMKFDSDSNPEYLLHFLIFKKWQHLADVTTMETVCTSLKAPSQFIPWLKTYWKSASEYIPDDKSLKGSKVSQFLLDLDTDDVLESLTDALQMAIFPEVIQNGVAHVDVFSDTPLFVVDKMGVDTDVTQHLNDKVKSKRKRSLNNDSETEEPECNANVKLSPKKKKQKIDSIEVDNDMSVTNGIGFVMDRGRRGIIPDRNTVEMEKHNGGKDSEEDEGSSDEENESEEDELEQVDIQEEYTVTESDDNNESKLKKLRMDFKSSKKGSVSIEEKSEGSESGASEEDEEEFGFSESTTLASDILKRRNFLVSDPVSSYFSQNENDGDKIEVIQAVVEGSDSQDSDSSEENEPNIHHRTRSTDSESQVSSPKKSASPLKSRNKSSESPKKSPTKLNSPRKNDSKPNKELSNTTMSPKKSKNSSDSDDGQTFSVFHVSRDGNPKIDVPMETELPDESTSDKNFLQENISTKLSELRNSTPSKLRSTKKEEIDSPMRRSTRIRVPTNKDEDTPSKRPSSTAASLKDWLRPAVDSDDTPSTLENKNVGRKRKTMTPKQMTKIKDHYVSEEEISDNETENDSTVNTGSGHTTKTPKKGITKEDVFPTPPVKTYSKRDRKLSEKMTPLKGSPLKSDLTESPKKTKATPKTESFQKMKATPKVESPEKIKATPKTGSLKKANATPKEAKKVNSDGEEEAHYLRKSKNTEEEEGSVSTPSISQTRTSVGKSSAKKTKAKMENSEGEQEELVEKVTKKTPSKRKSISQLSKTPKNEDQSEGIKKKTSPSPGSKRRKSLRSSQLPTDD